MDYPKIPQTSLEGEDDIWGNQKSAAGESTFDDMDGTDYIVSTLYAIPETGEPFLTLAKLKKGIFEKASLLSLKSYILFSDIGSAAWEAAFEIDNNSRIELVKTSVLEEDKSWQVIIKNRDLRVLVSSVRFKPMGKYTSAFYNSIEINSNPARLIAYVKLVMEKLNRKPWEIHGKELEWDVFTRKTQRTKTEVIKQWAVFSDLPNLAPPSLIETEKPVCRRCNKTTEKEWVFCPFCGITMIDYSQKGIHPPPYNI